MIRHCHMSALGPAARRVAWQAVRHVAPYPLVTILHAQARTSATAAPTFASAEQAEIAAVPARMVTAWAAHDALVRRDGRWQLAVYQNCPGD